MKVTLFNERQTRKEFSYRNSPFPFFFFPLIFTRFGIHMFTKKSKTNLEETSLPLEEKDIKKSEEINDPSLKEDYVELKHVNKVYNKKVLLVFVLDSLLFLIFLQPI
mgnify:CR=1 FL=1